MSKESNKKTYYERKDAGRCVRCNQPADAAYCEDCRAQERIRGQERSADRKSRYQRLREAKLCTVCTAPAVKSRCPNCLASNAAKQAIYEGREPRGPVQPRLPVPD